MSIAYGHDPHFDSGARRPPTLGLAPTPPVVVAQHPLSGRHALIVGINYAPEPTGIAPYTTGMAEHLAEHAQSVTVLTGIPHYPNWRVPGPYRWALRSREQERLSNDHGLLVRRLRHYVPRHQNALTRGAYEATFMANAASVRIKNRPDLVIAVTPSMGGAVAAVKIAERHDAKLMVVVQDLMAKAASQSGMSGGGRVSAATASLEQYALTRADKVVVVSDAFRGAVEAYGVDPERIGLLPNWTHISSVGATAAEARSELGWALTPFTVVHTGNIGLKQDLGNLIEAARLLRHDRKVRFVIVGDGSQRQAVQQQATDLPNVDFVEPLNSRQYPVALAAADVLVVNERPGVADMSLPSKLTSYLTAGRPVLAAVGEHGATSRELHRTKGAALTVPPGDPARFVSGIRELMTDPARCATMAAAGLYYAKATLGREAATARLDNLIKDCIGQ